MILVTGATGLVGGHLVRQLVEDGKRVRAFCRRPDQAASNPMLAHFEHANLEWFAGDVLDFGSLFAAFEGVTEVYHCAAMVSFSPKDREKMHRVNIQGTENIVNLCLTGGIRKLIHCSSVAALGKAKEGKVISENTKWENHPSNSEYAVTKFLSEMEVWRGIEEGLCASIVNPSIIIGPGNPTESSGRLIQTVATGLKFYSPGSTGYVAAADVARAMRLLMDSDIEAKRFLLNGINCSYKEFFNKVANALNVNAPSSCPPRWLSEIGWRILGFWALISGKAPLITKETTESAYASRTYDGTAITQAIGFEYSDFDLVIKETAESYKRVQKH